MPMVQHVMTQSVRSMSLHDTVRFTEQLAGVLSRGDWAVRSDSEATGFTWADHSERAPPVRTGVAAAAGGAA